MTQNILLAIALLIVLKGLVRTLMPGPSKFLVKRAYTKFGTGFKRNLTGLVSAAIGIAVFFLAPSETNLAVPVLMVAFTCIGYGLALLLLLNLSFGIRLVHAFDTYSSGKVRVMGVITLSVGIAILLAVMTYYQ